MSRVKVWNDNILDHKEEFKGEKLEIPSKGYIEMDWEDAVQFRGQFMSPVINADGTHDPRGFKMIRVENPSEPIFKENPLVNHATGQVASSAEELAKLLEQVSHLRYATDNKAPVTSSQSAEMEALKEQVAALTALVQGQAEKKKPGPKPGFRKEAAG